MRSESVKKREMELQRIQDVLESLHDLLAPRKCAHAESWLDCDMPEEECGYEDTEPMDNVYLGNWALVTDWMDMESGLSQWAVATPPRSLRSHVKGLLHLALYEDAS